jgi:hypothetical protein
MPSSATPAPHQPPAESFSVFHERIFEFLKCVVGREQAARLAAEVVAELAAARDLQAPANPWDQAADRAVARVQVSQLLARVEPLFPALHWRTLYWLRLKVEGLDDAEIQRKMGAESDETMAAWRQEALQDLLARLRSREEP